jgi:hypothetical protein
MPNEYGRALYWSTTGVWFTGDPAEDYGVFELALYDDEPNPIEATGGFVNGVSVPYQPKEE